MKTTWMQRFYEQHGFWPIAGGSGEEHEEGEQQGEGEGEEEHEEGDPRIKELSDEAAKYRVKAKDAESRADSVAGELRAARVELAVRREAAKRDKPFADLDVVMKVLDLDAIATDTDSQPVEVGAALKHLADRHPYLLAEQAPSPTKVDPEMHVRSGTPMNRDRNFGKGIDRKKLEAKYPVLRRGR